MSSQKRLTATLYNTQANHFHWSYFLQLTTRVILKVVKFCNAVDSFSGHWTCSPSFSLLKMWFRFDKLELCITCLLLFLIH